MQMQHNRRLQHQRVDTEIITIRWQEAVDRPYRHQGIDSHLVLAAARASIDAGVGASEVGKSQNALVWPAQPQHGGRQQLVPRWQQGRQLRAVDGHHNRHLHPHGAAVGVQRPGAALLRGDERPHSRAQQHAYDVGGLSKPGCSPLLCAAVSQNTQTATPTVHPQ